MTQTLFKTSKISIPSTTALQVLAVFIFLASVLEETTCASQWTKNFPNKYDVDVPYLLQPPKGFIELPPTKQCNCPRLYWPVCGKDDRLYVNYCVRKCFGMKGHKYLNDIPASCVYNSAMMAIVPASWTLPEEEVNVTSTEPPLYDENE